MLVELGLVEQRYRAVLEVLEDGASVTDVARRYGVGRQAVHGRLKMHKVIASCEAVIGQTVQTCRLASIAAQQEACVGTMHDLVGVHRCACIVANRAEKSWFL